MIRLLRGLDLEFNHYRYDFLKYNCNSKRINNKILITSWLKQFDRLEGDFFPNKKRTLNNNFLNPQPKVVRIDFFGEISKSDV